MADEEKKHEKPVKTAKHQYVAEMTSIEPQQPVLPYGVRTYRYENIWWAFGGFIVGIILTLVLGSLWAATVYRNESFYYDKSHNHMMPQRDMQRYF